MGMESWITLACDFPSCGNSRREELDMRYGFEWSRLFPYLEKYGGWVVRMEPIYPGSEVEAQKVYCGHHRDGLASS